MMPRGKQKKTMSGAPAQNIKSVPGQRYGEAKEQRTMQTAMPAPNEMKAEQTRAPMPSIGQPQTPAPTPVRPRVDPQTYLNGLRTGTLKQPSDPKVPITSGLRSGPGVGPEALDQYKQKRQHNYMLQNLYRRTGNKLFLDMQNRLQ